MTTSEDYFGETEYEIGDLVVTTKDLRNDGTYPDLDIKVGDVLVEEGTRGVVVNVGIYLQQHVIYAVSFETGRVVGCLTRELTLPETKPRHQNSSPSAITQTMPAGVHHPHAQGATP